MKRITMKDTENNTLIPDILVNESGVSNGSKTYDKDTIDSFFPNIITNGGPGKTGRKIDGKDEYVQRFEKIISSNDDVIYFNLMSQVNITNISATLTNTSGHVFILPCIRRAFSDRTIEFWLNVSNNGFVLSADYDYQNSTLKIEITFTYK